MSVSQQTTTYFGCTTSLLFCFILDVCQSLSSQPARCYASLLYSDLSLYQPDTSFTVLLSILLILYVKIHFSLLCSLINILRCCVGCSFNYFSLSSCCYVVFCFAFTCLYLFLYISSFTYLQAQSPPILLSYLTIHFLAIVLNSNSTLSFHLALVQTHT